MKTVAFILSAGLGTRLYPLTADKPKALVEYQGKTLLEHAVNKVIENGIHDIVVNVHHFAPMIKTFLATHSFDARISVSDESDYLRDTAGGFKFAEPLLSAFETILLYNVDIISSIDLQQLIRTHIASGAMATLAVRKRTTSRYFIFDEQTLQLCGWTNHTTGEKIASRPCKRSVELAFSGIHVVNHQLLSLIPNADKQSFTPLYVRLSEKENIKAYLHQEDTWKDMGKIADFNL